MRRVSQKHIAKNLNLSQTTVAAVLRNDPRIRIGEDTRQRVLEEAEKGGYWPNRMAGTLRSGKSKIIGIAHCSTMHQVIVRKLHAVVSAVKAAGYLHVVQDTVHDPQGTTVCQFFRDLNVDGVVLIGAHPTFMEGGFKRYLQGVVPLVAIDIEENSLVPQFRSDRQQGFRILAEHLIALGHQRLAVLRAPLENTAYIFHSHGLDTGVAQALANAGLPPATIYCNTCPERETDIFYAPGKTAMAQLLDSGSSLPDAVICTNDAWAIGALSEAARRGIPVPDQLAIVGFQDELQARYTTPPLTSVNPPIDRIVQRALNYLVDLIQNEEISQNNNPHERFPCELVVRESCGAKLKRPTLSSTP